MLPELPPCGEVLLPDCPLVPWFWSLFLSCFLRCFFPDVSVEPVELVEDWPEPLSVELALPALWPLEPLEVEEP